MVYTVTLNPALDYNLYLNNVNEGAVNRVDRAAVLCGGKGINVSFVLNELGVDNVALGFVASFTGAELERRLRLSHIVTDFITLKNGFT
ncbi:MAG: 1-phosphofructokinase, partial [Clostridia bacterium]|nr:1-phosphofructokinase [Clostridia bacterium]